MARIYSETKKPFGEAIGELSLRRNVLLTAWRHELHRLDPREDLTKLRGTELWELTESVAKLSFPMFRSRMERWAAELASRGIRLERVIAAVDSLLEACMRLLMKRDPNYAPVVFRFHSVACSVLTSAYSEHQDHLAEVMAAKLADAEQRLHGASAYVTRVYEQERRSLSHDLHDEVGHDLVMLKLYLELLSGDLEQRNFSPMRPRLDDARTLVGHTLESIRRLVLDLGPAIFDDLGFIPAIKFYVRRFASSTGIKVAVTEGRLPDEIPLTHQVALYRVLQGALSNVVKHSRAKHVKIVLGCLSNAVLVMTIEDDGVGFDNQGTVTLRRFGLTAMRERIEVLGGKVHVQSWRVLAPGGRHGTRIEVDLPLPGEAT